MPNIKSAIKRVKVNATKNRCNRLIKSGVKASIKRLDKDLLTNNGAEAEILYRKAVSAVDKAACKGVLHPNAANRKKAQLTRKLQAFKASDQ